ncbi:MAG: ferredoxin, partial [Muribaculaceae bacterium]|nr:ferredoxin [Muribaculaceae bacterium]
MLKKLRVLLAVLFIVGITALFVDFTGTAIGITGWMAKVQFWPSVLGLDSLMGLNILVVLLRVLLTFIFGRIY